MVEFIDRSFNEYLRNFGLKFNPFQDKIPSEDVFINKDKKALIRIFRAITHNQSSISLLIGPAGSGKSENADYIVRNLPEEYIFWYNQVMKQSFRQLALTILRDLDPEFGGKLRSTEEVLRAFNAMLEALPEKNRHLLCIFDQGEHFSKDAIEFIVNATNPRARGKRPFSAIILAVPRFEHRLERWMDYYDTTLKRMLIKEYVRPFTFAESLAYIAKAIASGRGVNPEEIAAKKDLSPFTLEAAELIASLAQGHPSTLVDLCYLSLEKASEFDTNKEVSPEIVEEVWKNYNNKKLHKKAVEWYKEKGLYRED